MLRRVLGAALALVPLAGAAAPLPSFEAVRAAHARSDARLYDRHGELLHELRIDAQVRRLEWVALADVSPALQRAVLEAEDRRFYAHAGVDWTALGAAALRGLWNGNPRGASTLTMQLTAWLDPALRPDGKRRDLVQKWRQIEAARALEKRWTKTEIFEAYLNLVYFRSELQGIAAAARGLFDKQPSGLNDTEALLLAALLRAPAATPEAVAARACRLGVSLGATGNCADIAALANARLAGPFRVRPAANDAPHVARALLTPATPRATSTLDANLQRFAQAVLAQQLNVLGGERVRDGAVLVADNASGEVLAYVGNSGRGFVDGVIAPRQAGSTLKPFLYALALGQRTLTAASILDDSPVNLVTPTGLYVPQNYDKDFKGLVSVRTALGSSLNVPAVRTLMLIGTEPFVAQLRRLGFAGLTESGDFYGYSLALGSAEVSLWQLVNAYRTLANGGAYSPLTLVPGVRPKPRTVLDPAASFIVADMLADRAARGLTFGLDNVLATPFWSAVKTGTSKDMRDNWCVGFSKRFTVGVWVGNFDGSPMQDVSGVTGAAPVWLEIMSFLHRGRPAQPPKVPAGVVTAEVRFTPAIETPRREYFLTGTESADVRLLDRTHRLVARISYPGRGAILAIDPDIPPGHERVFFEITPAGDDYVVRIDGETPVSAQAGWQPQPGRHRVELLNWHGMVLDRTEFEVRGGAVADGRP